MLIRVALMIHGEELWSRLGRIVFVGTPHYGSPAIGGYLKNHFWGFDMLLARYGPILFTLAVAGALAGKRFTPAGLGTLRTDNTTFSVLLIGVIVLVGALTFFPALLLGPIVQGLTGHLY